MAYDPLERWQGTWSVELQALNISTTPAWLRWIPAAASISAFCAVGLGLNLLIIQALFILSLGTSTVTLFAHSRNRPWPSHRSQFLAPLDEAHVSRMFEGKPKSIGHILPKGGRVIDLEYQGPEHYAKPYWLTENIAVCIVYIGKLQRHAATRPFYFRKRSISGKPYFYRIPYWHPEVCQRIKELDLLAELSTS